MAVKDTAPPTVIFMSTSEMIQTSTINYITPSKWKLQSSMCIHDHLKQLL